MLVRAVLPMLVLVQPARAAPGPCDDFEAYVNEAWRASQTLHPEHPRVGSFDMLRRANERLLVRALGELLADPAQQTTAGLRALATHYGAGMDLEAIEQRGLKALEPVLDRIAQLQRDQLPELMADLARWRVAAPLTLTVAPDARDATRTVLQLGASGLTLPDRDDYLQSDDESQRVRAAGRRYAQRMLGSEADADDALALENALARATLPRTQRRDPRTQLNPHTLPSLSASWPGFDWNRYLARYTEPEADRLREVPLNVSQPAFVQALVQLSREASLPQWRAYLRLRLLDALAEKLPRAYAEAHFEFRQQALRGVQRAAPRAERLVLAIGGPNGGEPLGQALGELYASRTFSASAQRRAQALVEDLRDAMADRIRTRPWMSEATRQQALAKLQGMVSLVGVPAQWRRYEGLELRRDDFAGNDLRLSEWATREALRELGRGVDRQRWTLGPYVVNAFAANGNRIVFPAGILQPPFFDELADDASNYGAIGSVIGHEITHHFDDRGRRFDAAGTLRDWWTPEDDAAYRARAQRVVELFNGYEPLPQLRVNGQLTLGENIADLGGVQIAWDALQRALARRQAMGLPQPLVDGRAPAQQFFVAHATLWRSKERPEWTRQLLRTDAHAPSRFRVIGALTHTPAFAQAFGCKAGDAMVADTPIVIW